MTRLDWIDFDHIQSERLRVLQLLLADIKTIAEEVVVCTGHPADGEHTDKKGTKVDTL